MSLLLVCFAGSHVAAAAADKEHDNNAKPSASRADAELLALYGMDDTRLKEFNDGRPAGRR